jgi:large subunit ribosomal protein L18
MKSAALLNKVRQLRRKRHVRARIRRESDRLRLSVHRSSKHIYAQVIEDATGRTLAHASSTAKGLAAGSKGKPKTERAKAVGEEIARKAKEAGIETVVFDRGSAKYHGRVKALADAAREGGLKF